MNWADEHYVKLFTRDTVTWRSWPWQARALFPLLMRAVDGAGMLNVGSRELGRSVALMVDLPADVALPGVEALLADGTLELVNGNLIIGKFLEAQESRKTNAQSKVEQREKAKAVARRSQVLGDTTQHRQTAADGDRSGHPPAQLSSAQPIEAVLANDASKPTRKPRKLSAAEDFFAWASARRLERTKNTDQAHTVAGINAVFGRALVDVGRSQLEARYLAYLDEPDGASKEPPWPWRGFAARWQTLRNSASRNSQPESRSF